MSFISCQFAWSLACGGSRMWTTRSPWSQHGFFGSKEQQFHSSSSPPVTQHPGKRLYLGPRTGWTGHLVTCSCVILPTLEKVQVTTNSWTVIVAAGEIQAASHLKRGVARARWCAQSLSNLAVSLQPLHTRSSGSFLRWLPRHASPPSQRPSQQEPSRKKEVPPVQFFVQDNGSVASDVRAADCVGSVGGWYSEKQDPTSRDQCHFF